MFILNLAALLYLAGTIFLVTFVSGFGVLLLIYLLTRHRNPTAPTIADDDLLSVTIQLPVYNEPAVIDRLLDACTHLDYPSDKLHIQILDDSTDDTTALIQHKIAGLPNVSHIHREDRQGYKAGALAYGLSRIQTDCIVVFDADFVPGGDFLHRTMPYFNANPSLGLIQTRWGHLNLETNWLTRAQALNIDAHFGIEQVARNRGKLPMSMNGTGGIWRAEAIHDAGGWSSATLTEDLDLSYRAFMRGWQFLYLVDVAVPGELPPLIQAYKTQQARWATGSTQCLLRHVGNLLHCRNCSLLEKWMGALHLAQYAAQPVILMLFLLTPLLLWGDMFRKLPDLTIMATVGLIPLLIIITGQLELYDDWRKRLVYLPVQLITAIAIVLNNSRAVLAALRPTRKEREFKRTPKFHLTQQTRNWSLGGYGLKIDLTTIGELLLAAYATFGFVLALRTIPALAPYMLSYAVSFSLFATWNIYQTWRYTHRPIQANSPAGD